MIKRIKNKVASHYRSFHWRFYNAIYSFFLSRMKLAHKLPTDISVKVSSFADWSIYNDIFVAGEYDSSIRQVLRVGSGPVRILDLGANVGLFIKRVLHLRRSEAPDVAVELICVEGAPSTYALLQQQIPELRSDEKVKLLQGLAGRKSGEAVLATNPFHAMTGLARHPKMAGVAVRFIDLNEATRHWPRIDLLKCDIEGAEQLVLENYQDLLKKVNLAVFEFHLDRVNREQCLSLTAKAGLTQREIFHENQYISVEALHR